MRSFLALAVMAVFAVPTLAEQPADQANSANLTYKQAYAQAATGDKPLLVLVTADWCPPCVRMKQTTIPQLMQKNAFANFHFAAVNYDQESDLADQLIGDRGLPQLIMFEKDGDEWVRRYLRGIQNVPTVEAFVAQAGGLRTANVSNNNVDK